MSVPIYIIAGFLESGKTGFLKEVLSEDSFPAEEKKLIICCEDGEDEYEEEFLKRTNAELVMAESLEELDGERLKELDDKYEPERVFIEYNGFWSLKELFSKKKPRKWELFQVISIVDAGTFEMYSNNMRSLFAEMFSASELIVFNRCDENTNRAAFRRFAKGTNPAVQTIFENTDGTSDDGVTDEELPFDVNAVPIVIKDEDFAVFYIDHMDHPERYSGKMLKLRGMVYKTPELAKDTFYFCRMAMTCCADDIGLAGFVCKSAVADKLADRSWITLNAVMREEKHEIYGGEEGGVLYAKKIGEAKKPADELAYFM